MRYLHSMVRVRDLEASLRFYCELLGLHEIRRKESPQGRFTLVFLAAPGQDGLAEVELTWNWDDEDYGGDDPASDGPAFPPKAGRLN